MMNKQGVEMSMQTMVVAALVIIILVILITLMVRQTGIFEGSINSCEEKGDSYDCQPDRCGQGYNFVGTQGCEEGYVCCQEEGALFGNN